MVRRIIGMVAAAWLAVMMGASVDAAEPSTPATGKSPASTAKPATPAAKPAAAAAAAAPAPRAVGLRSSWACLPAGETVFAVRIPSGQQMLKSLRADTKFGSVVLSEARMQKIVDLMKEESAGKWDNMVRDLAKYGLKPEDWSELLAGEAGMGVSLAPTVGKEGEAAGTMQVMALMWLEPGGDLGKRLYAAIQQGVDEEQGKADAPKRVDVELEGQTVMRITHAEYVATPLPAIELPAGFDQLTDAEQKAWWDKQNAEAKKAAGQRKLKGHTHVLVTLMGNRLVAGIAPPVSSMKHMGLGGEERQATAAELAQAAEHATGAFARFLAEHKKSGEQGGATGALLATPGAAAALPTGTTAVEMVADLRSLITQLQAHATDADAARMMDLSGIRQLGPMAMRITLDKGAMRTGAFASMPAPRTGLMTLLDQPALASEPAAFTPADAIGYQHVSFDLGKAYLRIKELAIAGFGQQAEQGFMSAEQSAMGMLQVELPALLSSLGQQHTIVNYAPAVEVAAAGAGGAGPRPGAGRPGTVSTRTALVWQVKDTELWKRVLQAAGMMAAGGPVMWAEEQGFSGWRMKQPAGGGPGGAEGGLFVGKNYLTLAIGPQVSETTLNTLSKPPEGKASMRGSDQFQRARALLALKPSQLFHVSDVNRSMPLMREMFIAGLQQMAMGGAGLHMDGMNPGMGAPDDDDDVDEERLPTGPGLAPRPMQHDHAGHGNHGPGGHGRRVPVEKITAIVPTEKELDGVMGVYVGQLLVSPQGVAYQAAVEMPPVK